MLDLILKNCTIIDGTGAPRYEADIAVEGDSIEEIGRLDHAVSKEEIDAHGLTVAPGFIDVHSHADFSLPLEDHDEVLSPLAMQGITTFVGGNCGFSTGTVPAARRREIMDNLESLSGRKLDEISWSTPSEFMSFMERRGMLLNVGLLAGHGTLRIGASGLVTRLLTGDEQACLERLLDEAMEAGCLGMSTGLQYFPGVQSDTVELAGCGKVLKKYGGIFTSHLRSYAHTLNLAMDEVIEVGRSCGIPVQISHLYWQPYMKGFTSITKAFISVASYLYNRIGIPVPMEKGLAGKLKILDNARARGVDVHFDMVPTSQGFTELAAFLPPYLLEGSLSDSLTRLADPSFRKRMLHDIEHVEPEWPHRDGATWSFNYLKMTGWNGLRVMAVGSEANRWMEGKTFPEIGRERKKHPLDVICDLLIEEEGKVMVFHTPTFPDDPLVFRSMWAGFIHEMSMPVTDTILRPMGRPSHVFFDCFPRFLSEFVMRKKLLTMEEAVRKCTSLPAEVFGIRRRGVVKKGYFADLVAFDAERLGTRANFNEPRVHPDGIYHVFVNGRAVVSNGQFRKGTLAGKMIRKK